MIEINKNNVKIEKIKNKYTREELMSYANSPYSKSPPDELLNINNIYFIANK